ncbi:2-amino-4-hydroxy-6-hydroxymethyldihydropteridine diphosphokinase [Jannaschia formosa]|uniref:2-amino-4-hydroxy-6- hydroxymethyldihydropteridine diphosphokinase n=1 Tax=Jannaschia formosa TaxID=2259592 RepID=UPI000E1C19AE|nr:2-amino-4-hydroxy-6-hydroxymethyldihydropteridine diphosphokinase [Jannaschia formosa]TFL17460.1 2-amino-4-hydroxy-6-hydroxymethyldihydropteridine diphosphokinase [Jannaschia formosa]
MTLHLVALGANAGVSRAANARRVSRAMGVLAALFPGRVAGSALYATPAWPPASGPEFVNAAMSIRAPLPPARMLALLHRVEARLGRVRGRRWGERKLDLDLLASGAAVRPDEVTQSRWRRLAPDRQRVETPQQLILPHPRLQDRAFVLIPLAEIAPGWRHPLTGRSVAEMVAALPAAARRDIRPLPAAKKALVKRSGVA